jgi:hypothetical protein
MTMLRQAAPRRKRVAGHCRDAFSVDFHTATIALRKEVLQFTDRK